MSDLNKIIKKSIETLLETKGFEDMEVAFGVKNKSDNLSNAEKTQFGPMGQVKNSKEGTFTNPPVPGTKEVQKANTQNNKDAESYYKEVVKKVKAYQTPNDEKFEVPKVNTNGNDEDDRIKVTGYDVGNSGMEVTADKAEKEGGSEDTKKKYKERLDKLNGNDATYQKLKKNADKTNTKKYDKDERNTRPVKSQVSKQSEQPEKKNENIMKKNSNLINETEVKNPDVQKFLELLNNKVMEKYPKAKDKVNTPIEIAELIAIFAEAFGVTPDQLGRVKSLMQKQEKQKGDENVETNNKEEESKISPDFAMENVFKTKGKIISEEQVIKLANKVPARIKIDETKFSITDGENTYKLIWEGNENGEPVITNISNSKLVKEDINKMKHLWGFKPKENKQIVKEEAEEVFKKMFREVKKKS